jgi:enediyne biosynthesis protein E4
MRSGVTSRVRRAVYVAVLVGVGAACARTRDADERPWFVEATDAAGLTFTHHNGRTGQFYYPEVIAPGVALIDADADGDLDVFLIQSDDFGAPKAQASTQHSRFFRNDLEVRPDGTRRLTFSDQTQASGLAVSGYGMGVAAGDIDKNGCVDLLTTSLAGVRLFRNSCRGFVDASERSGLARTGWNVSASFVDVDRDGWLDLFVGHYLTWDPSLNTPCFGTSGRRVYCAPQVYRAQPSHLYRNNRDGTFTDVTAAAGMATQFGPALGVSTADFNGDGWIDIYVANDREENQLWTNRHNGTFENTGLLSGTALGPFGQPKSGMGVDAGDMDDDGDEDIVVTNLTGEGHDLYVNDGTGTFVNASAVAGLNSRSLPYTGFGAGWIDVDNDGWLDLLTVNGAVQIPEAPGASGALASLGQAQQLFRNLGHGRFDDVTRAGGPGLLRMDASRGAAFGDVDNDGDTDVVVANNGGPAQLLLNAIGQRQHWVGLRLLTAQGSDALGARVAVTVAGGRTRWRRARADGSYASANDPRVLVGLGSSTGPVNVRVIWPDGKVEAMQVEIDRYTPVVEGKGRTR